MFHKEILSDEQTKLLHVEYLILEPKEKASKSFLTQVASEQKVQ